MHRRSLLTAAPALLLAPRTARAADHPVASTINGPVRGVRDGGVLTFKGVRYGADTGPRRFRPPVRPGPWARPVDAFTYGAASPQPGREPDQGEDCLFLNVWTPGLDDARRPVMVYVHGGAYATGSGSSPLTDGARLARRRDVVVVTVNHRLNLFGYAYLARFGVFPDSGNAGQLDLILALEWVRDSIAAFGGDPARVMVFGQSGGGAKIATLMATPDASGLFHRAATMSGQQVTASGPINATTRARAWLDALDLPPERAAEAASLPVDRLLKAAEIRDPVLPYGGLYFGPVLDGRTLSRHPFYPDAPAQSAGMPMMIGNTRDETLAFTPADTASLGWDDLPGRMTLAQMRVDIAPEPVIAEYRRLYPDYSPGQVFIAATTAARSWRAAIIEAERRAEQGSPAFVYQLDWPTTLADGRRGTPHGSDIPLVFDAIAVNAPGAPAMADRVSAAFAAFAATGDPNHAGLPVWAPYILPRRQTMMLDDVCRMQDDPRGDERRLFATVPYVQPGT